MAVLCAEIIGLFFLAILSILLQVNCDDSAQLEAYWGQEGTTFGDGKSCYRDCDGNPKVCYYKFKVEHYNTMGSRCGDCALNITGDCFKESCIPANGLERNVRTINRQIPGPTINTCVDDEIVVDVENHMSGSALTIHWHGVHHVLTPWMDGVPMVTQCPIHNGNKFRYRFVAEEGTHFYHAHTGLHRADGVFGRLVARLPKANDSNGDLYDFDEDQHSILLTDWTRKMATEFEPGTSQELLRVDNILINGLGCDTNQNETNCDVMPLPTFYMQYGKSYRWRVVQAASQNCAFEFTIQGHNLTCIATDSFSIEPVIVDAVVSSPGERYDLVVHALTDRKIKEALVRVRGLGNCATTKKQSFGRILFVEDPSHCKGNISDARPYPDQLDYDLPFNRDAVYLNNPSVDCRSSVHLCAADLTQKGVRSPTGLNLRQVVPNREIPLRFSVSLSEREPSSFLAVGTRSLLTHINNIVMKEPSVVGLTQDDSHVPYCNESTVANKNTTDGMHFCTHLIQLEHHEVVDFLFFDDNGPSGVAHPIHLHGHGFQVIDMGTREQYETNTTPYANDTNPPCVKDTVVVPSAGFTRVRFNATNAGYWFFHCHFEWHMHLGMRAIVRVGHKSEMLQPPSGFLTCGDYAPSVIANNYKKGNGNIY